MSDDLELLILLHPPSESWRYGQALSYLIWFMQCWGLKFSDYCSQHVLYQMNHIPSLCSFRHSF